MAEYDPGYYVKGDTVRVAQTRAQAVALVFDGYTLDAKPTQRTKKSAKPASSTPAPDTKPEPDPTA